MQRAFVIGTCDTKEAELLYAKAEVERMGAAALLVDVSTRGGSPRADVSAVEVARHHPRGEFFVLGSEDRGTAVSAMAEALVQFLISRRDVGGVLGMGGSGNTVIVTAAMRALPVGIPKLMVSTVAAGNIAPYIGPSDIAMMYAVTDIAGLNAISRTVIGNAAHALAGMMLNPVEAKGQDKPGVGITMFGVTTPCVAQIREIVEKTHECFVFHATGIGGQSMEKLVDSGMLAAVIDVTTTEVADFLCGGILPCTADRFGAVIRTSVPYVGSVGALDMVNFGPRESVPQKFAGRLFHIHNPQVTLMRTMPEENSAIGSWIVERLIRMPGPVRFLLPLRGISAIDAQSKPFYDRAADEALFTAIRKGWTDAPNHRLIEVDAHINDKAFAEECIKQFLEIT